MMMFKPYRYLMVVIACLGWSSVAQAQRADTPPTPTVRILAIGTVPDDVAPERVAAILPSEVQATVKLYLEGKIDQWFSLQDDRGVAFILNVTDVDEARALLEKLPLGQVHLMTFQLIRLGPLNPLRRLLSAQNPGSGQ